MSVLQVSLLIILVFFCLGGHKLLSRFIDGLLHNLIIFLINCGISLQRLNLAVAVTNQRCDFGSLPVLSKSLDNSQHEPFLIVTKLATLAHGIKTNNVLLLACQKWRKLNAWPLPRLSFEWLTIGLSRLHSLLLLILKLIDFLLELCLARIDILVVGQSRFKSLV